jgi:hypothetical protein
MSLASSFALCSVCTHPKCAELEPRTFIESHADVAKAYPPLSRDSISRHMRTHYQLRLEMGLATGAAEFVLPPLIQAQAVMMVLAENRLRAKAAGDFAEVRKCCDSMLKGVVLMARLQGGLPSESQHTTVNLFQSPQFQQIVAVLETQFAGKPDERRKFAAELARLSAGLPVGLEVAEPTGANA